MGGFLIRIIVALGLAAGIFYLATGTPPTSIPQPTEEGFQVERKTSESSDTIAKWRDKALNFFSGEATSTEEIKGDDSEADVSFFKSLLPEKSNATSTKDKDNEEDSFLKKITDKIKKQFNQDDEEDGPPSALSGKVGSVPSFTVACFPDSKLVCSTKGCNKSSPQVEFTLLNKDKLLIAHCDSGGCVTYDATYEEEGGYENYQPQTPKGYIITRESEPSNSEGRTEYSEIITRGNEITIYSGGCLEKTTLD